MDSQQRWNTNLIKPVQEHQLRRSTTHWLEFHVVAGHRVKEKDSTPAIFGHWPYMYKQRMKMPISQQVLESWSARGP